MSFCPDSDSHMDDKFESLEDKWKFVFNFNCVQSLDIYCEFKNERKPGGGILHLHKNSCVFIDFRFAVMLCMVTRNFLIVSWIMVGSLSSLFEYFFHCTYELSSPVDVLTGFRRKDDDLNQLNQTSRSHHTVFPAIRANFARTFSTGFVGAQATDTDICPRKSSK